jgi:hypothetical protein
MRKRLLILAGVALAAAVIVAGALEFHAYRQKLARGRLIDQEHCDRIKDGMSRAEVEDILGGPPGDFTTEAVVYFLPLRRFGCDGVWVASWNGNSGRVLVQFDGQGAVRQREFQGVSYRPAPPPSLVARLRAWLRRVWP